MSSAAIILLALLSIFVVADEVNIGLATVSGSKPLAPNGVHDMTTYESRIGEQGLLIGDNNIQMWVPARYEPHSRIIFDYLVAGYTTLYSIFGDHIYPYKFSIEHYPEGSPYIWGGTDARGTIRYGYSNLEDDTPEWNLHGVPHVIGYFEEMAHCFIYDLGNAGFYEALGMIIGGEATLRAAWNPHIQELIDDGYDMFAATTAYYLEHNTGEPGVPENIYLTRILAHIFKTEVIDTYGWVALSEAFEAAQVGYPIRQYDSDHTWGGFLGLLSSVIGTDMHTVFRNYGLPMLKWTGESGFESDGYEPLNDSNRYHFRIKVTDREGTQPSDVKVHFYYHDGSAVERGLSLVEGNSSVGWIYELETVISESYEWEYAFSANDGVHPVFQAVGNPTEKQFVRNDGPFYVTFQQCGCGGTPHVVVDDTSYALPYSTWMNGSSSHSFAFESLVTEGETKWVLTSTSHSSPITITGPTTITGYYNSSEPIELYYDDGDAESGYATSTLPHYKAVRFHTPTTDTYKLGKVKYYIYGNPSSFELQIRDASAQIVYSEVVTPTEVGWFIVDLASEGIYVQGDFYVAMKYLEVQQPELGADYNDPDGESGEGVGFPAPPNLVSLDWMIRAILGSSSARAHDIEVANLMPSKTVVGQEYSVSINVTIKNQGDYNETFNVTVYANTTVIETKEISLTSGDSAAVTFNWNTTAIPLGNYSISANAILEGDINTTDNTFIDDWIVITIPADINGDGEVDWRDLLVLAQAYGSEEGEESYVPEADFNSDGEIDWKDLLVLAQNYGES